MEWYWWTDAAGRNFTRNVDLQGYAVCFGAVLVHRKLQGKWRTTAWPLLALLSFTEHTVAYRMAFTQVQAELSRRGLPQPQQLNSDYFEGSRKAAKEVWPELHVVHDLWHLRKNIRENSSASASKAVCPCAQAPVAAAALWNRKVCRRSFGRLQMEDGRAWLSSTHHLLACVIHHVLVWS